MSNEIVKPDPGAIQPTKWDDQLAQYAQEASEAVDAGGQFISLQAGVISINDEPVKDNKLKVIVEDFRYENLYYKGKFNPKEPRPPVCFALGKDKNTLAPHPDSTEPQAADCAHCPKNQFGSSENPDRPDGKACKNTRRLGLISADIPPADIPTTEVLYLKTPVTSSKAWDSYVKAVSAMFKRPPFGVVTEIGVKPDKNSQFVVTFRPLGLLPEEYLGPVIQKHEIVSEMIEFPYSPMVELEPKEESKKF